MEKPQLRVVEGGSMDKQKALEAALAQIDKLHGKGSIMRLGANDRIMDVEAISTGSLGLDIALGIVMGSMVEQNLVTSLIKSDGNILPFFSRPVAAVLAAMTIAALLWPVGVWLMALKRRLLA